MAPCGEGTVPGPPGPLCSPHLAPQPLHVVIIHCCWAATTHQTLCLVLRMQRPTSLVVREQQALLTAPFPPHLTLPPSRPGTRHTCCSPVQRVVCRTWHLLGFSHLCALLLCTFWSSPRIRLSPSLTLADTYLACKTPFWPCFYQEAFCNAHRLGMIPSCSPCVPT